MCNDDASYEVCQEVPYEVSKYVDEEVCKDVPSTKCLPINKQLCEEECTTEYETKCSQS